MANALIKPQKNRFANEEMADVQFGDLRNCSDWNNIVERQTVSGMGSIPFLTASAAQSAIRFNCEVRSSPSRCE